MIYFCWTHPIQYKFPVTWLVSISMSWWDSILRAQKSSLCLFCVLGEVFFACGKSPPVVVPGRQLAWWGSKRKYLHSGVGWGCPNAQLLGRISKYFNDWNIQPFECPVLDQISNRLVWNFNNVKLCSKNHRLWLMMISWKDMYYSNLCLMTLKGLHDREWYRNEIAEEWDFLA